MKFNSRHKVLLYVPHFFVAWRTSYSESFLKSGGIRLRADLITAPNIRLVVVACEQVAIATELPCTFGKRL